MGHFSFELITNNKIGSVKTVILSGIIQYPSYVMSRRIDLPGIPPPKWLHWMNR